jgi:hypothetical protein
MKALVGAIEDGIARRAAARPGGHMSGRTR